MSRSEGWVVALFLVALLLGVMDYAWTGSFVGHKTWEHWQEYSPPASSGCPRE